MYADVIHRITAAELRPANPMGVGLVEPVAPSAPDPLLIVRALAARKFSPQLQKGIPDDPHARKTAN